MMPLCTTATRSASSRCGCALASVAGPWVAHRVWPMPILPANRFGQRRLEVADAAGRLGHPQRLRADARRRPAES